MFPIYTNKQTIVINNHYIKKHYEFCYFLASSMETTRPVWEAPLGWYYLKSNIIRKCNFLCQKVAKYFFLKKTNDMNSS